MTKKFGMGVVGRANHFSDLLLAIGIVASLLSSSTPVSAAPSGNFGSSGASDKKKGSGETPTRGGPNATGDSTDYKSLIDKLLASYDPGESKKNKSSGEAPSESINVTVDKNTGKAGGYFLRMEGLTLWYDSRTSQFYEVLQNPAPDVIVGRSSDGTLIAKLRDYPIMKVKTAKPGQLAGKAAGGATFTARENVRSTPSEQQFIAQIDWADPSSIAANMGLIRKFFEIEILIKSDSSKTDAQIAKIIEHELMHVADMLSPVGQWEFALQLSRASETRPELRAKHLAIKVYLEMKAYYYVDGKSELDIDYFKFLLPDDSVQARDIFDRKLRQKFEERALDIIKAFDDADGNNYFGEHHDRWQSADNAKSPILRAVDEFHKHPHIGPPEPYGPEWDRQRLQQNAARELVDLWVKYGLEPSWNSPHLPSAPRPGAQWW